MKTAFRQTVAPILTGLILLAAQGCDAEKIAQEEPVKVNFTAVELLGRPTDTTITLTVSADQALTIQAIWGQTSGIYTAESSTLSGPAGEPLFLTLDGLLPDTGYYYRLRWRTGDHGNFTTREEGRLHTRRLSGSPFTFTVQADSHLDGNSDLSLYHQTLGNILTDQPDFHIDLGDTFMCDKYSQPLTAQEQPAPDAAAVDARYLYERGNFGLISHSVPLFLVNGNHEGENGRLLTGHADCLPVWAALARQRYFLNPVPDGFYSGDSTREPFIGQRAAWYAWEWGDALFIVLEPYWNTTTAARRDGWAMTLGKTQYDWLKTCLETSRAPFRFIFIHGLVGALDGQQRGGIEAAPYYEWGGLDENGSTAFPTQRPGWAMPIHELLVKTGVDLVFHGHDHLYARQELDGITYLTVPQPSTTRYTSAKGLAEMYHYRSGVLLSSSGHVRVRLEAGQAILEYVRAYRPQDEDGSRKNGQVDDRITLTPR